MNNKETVILVVIMFIGVLASFCAGVLEGAKATRRLAIKAGVGHYVANPTNGITQFEFKTQTQNQK